MPSAADWRPGPRPDWVRALNRIQRPEWISLDPDEMIGEAVSRTDLDDFGGDGWREGYGIFTRSLVEEAQLNAVGRLLARSDVVNWLVNRLEITACFAAHPGIADERVEEPWFITGLPRTGTSILHELLGCDPASRVPRAWEVRHPCPPPQAVHDRDDPRIARADEAVRLWADVVPEYDAMHELGARLPVECIQITAHEFRSDELSGRHVVPSYAGWLAGADLVPAYAFHRRMLQLLQWRAPGERWVLKAPSHLGALDALLSVYPRARIVWTHRDPLSVMASVASILFSTAWVRSDAVRVDSVLQWFTGETCAALLEAAERVRAAVSDPDRFHDVRYADLVADPMQTVAGVYDHFGVALTAEAESAIRRYSGSKPKGKHGAHRYEFENTGFDAAEERRRFRDYQRRYGVASER